jgi:hypothetical protein
LSSTLKLENVPPSPVPFSRLGCLLLPVVNPIQDFFFRDPD